MTEGWFVLDPAAVIFVAMNLVIGACSLLVSPRYLAGARRRWYYGGLLAFWAALLLIPVVSNLGVAWLLIEATTAASAALVAYSGHQRALEAGWKYLVLTTAGLTVALLGVLYLDAGLTGTDYQVASPLSLLDWSSLHAAAGLIPTGSLAVATVLILVGLAGKVGWAPVHQWLPDAHSEAPAPVSALLSASLLPTVMLVAWRFEQAIATALSQRLFLIFGLVSLAVAVPFLLRPLPMKRLLAYSSLEHMGLLAVGIGFGSPLALLGVAVHVLGHAAAKALGFYSTIPLYHAQSTAARRPASGLAHLDRKAAWCLGVSLAALSGLPPSPLFISELLILAGGVAAHQYFGVGLAAILLSLGFVGLAHQSIEALLGRPRKLIAARTHPTKSNDFTGQSGSAA
jgi:hydrogenase-4 component F